ncbi:uncharacterized protein hrob [Xenentodon cancila]
MTAMTCKLSGLFSIGEDFDDEDLLGTDWTACSASATANETAAVSSCSLRASSVAHREPEKVCHQQRGESSTSQHNGPASVRSTHAVAAGLRRLSNAAQPHTAPPPALIRPETNLAARQSRADTKELLKPGVAEDEFDDWDVDLADLDECDSLMGQLPKPAAAVEPLPSAKTQHLSTSGGGQTLPNRTLRGLSTACKTSGSSSYASASQNLSGGRLQPPNPCMSSPSAHPQSPTVFPGLTATSPAPSSLSRTFRSPQQQQKTWVPPQASPQARGLFETVSPGPSSSVSSSSLSTHPLHTPILTNRLVQLVSASNKLPKKRPRSEAHQPRTRRFPGPAGLLPQQPQGQNLDQIVVSVPQTPAHGVVARLPSQGSCSQTEEDEFSTGAWAAMKAEMGLDERNPSCFLHTYSVVMVLRKAALKQLARNKAPNMAVLLKSLVHTHADAKAVFKDPTGEIQGTVHRRLLDDRADELRVGAVLLLKQVGVFSPSHRNHYLNVTPNNLLRIYAPDGVGLSSTQLPALVLGPMSPSAPPAPPGLQEPVSQMQLVFDEDDDEGKEVERCMERGGNPLAQTHTENEKSTSCSRGVQESGRNPSPQDAVWDADDDLDELLGEMPEDAYSL